ncbi:hypothetical protein H6G74_23130 [Nostoc spongiaeforme FACHB-130]|uniref:Uncharacterized protein n=1 Tax=Nostoc spongiaeforme FACHB-130 TaxID=1357510 RepID=A0ABR8G1R6_9NOSO|nr:hypothetical protein [Nostoc spongiaeforme]MBD2597195.1 hypothetical protein [Nostoc spongiaeforme FACHB-130]
MTAIFPDVEKFKYIDPRQVEAYLVAHGWQQQQRQGDKAAIWTLDGFEILLPLKPEIIDFSRRMAEVVETLALAETRTQQSVCGELITNAPNTTIQAVVTHIATPNADHLSGDITMLGIVVDKLRPIQTELADRDYILALKAYQERLPVYCTGDLIKENGRFILKNPHRFSLDETEMML